MVRDSLRAKRFLQIVEKGGTVGARRSLRQTPDPRHQHMPVHNTTRPDVSMYVQRERESEHSWRPQAVSTRDCEVG